MAKKPHPSVIVAGGGIGGLSAAMGLARTGANVTVLEQADTFGEIVAGKHAVGALIEPDGLEVVADSVRIRTAQV
jgi:salicylate hydroxylase